MPSESLKATTSSRTEAEQICAKSIEYCDGLYRYALSLTRNSTEAEDLVQETFLRAMPAMPRLRSDSNVRAWLFTILRNTWFNELRRQRNAPQMIEFEDHFTDSLSVPLKDPYDEYESKIEAEELRSAIQRLQPRFREIILLREFEDLSYKEIAIIMDCPIGTVLSRVSRARARLRRLIGYSSKLQEKHEICVGL
jgi:RNA polymerase sigma-70 factor (ECF subfamily)